MNAIREEAEPRETTVGELSFRDLGHVVEVAGLDAGPLRYVLHRATGVCLRVNRRTEAYLPDTPCAVLSPSLDPKGSDRG